MSQGTQGKGWTVTDLLAQQLHWEYVRAPGPGGQHVNKTASAVQLKIFPNTFALINDAHRFRLLALAGRRLNKDGSIQIIAHRHRSLEANKRDAIDRLLDLINQSAKAPKSRRATQPTKASRERRLGSKKTTSQRKQLRRKPAADH
jgi:ribosome-associated protein